MLYHVESDLIVHWLLINENIFNQMHKKKRQSK